LKDAPSSISAAKLNIEYRQNQKYIQLQEKTQGGRRNIVAGGFQTSPQRTRLRDPIKLPPLSYKPVFDSANNTN
jgi:hypothetical protein